MAKNPPPQSPPQDGVALDIFVLNYHGTDTANTTYRVAWSTEPQIAARDVDMRLKRFRALGDAVGSEIVRGPGERLQAVVKALEIADKIKERRRAHDAGELTLEEIAQLAARAATNGDIGQVRLAGKALAGDRRALLSLARTVREDADE